MTESVKFVARPQILLNITLTAPREITDILYGESYQKLRAVVLDNITQNPEIEVYIVGSLFLDKFGYLRRDSSR